MSADSGLVARETLVLSQALAPLDAILCTERLAQRPQRPPDYETENRALTALVEALANSPDTILQKLADTLLDVFGAGSAGLSLLTSDGKSFYWPAIAGGWQPHKGGGTPRDFGPCGDVLDRNVPLLFTHWELRYHYLAEATPLAEEGLLVPFYVSGKAVGTIWAIAHDKGRQFDAEDLRQLESFARFASAAYQGVERVRAEASYQSAQQLLRKQSELLADVSESEHRIRELLDDRFLEPDHGTGDLLVDSSFVVDQTRSIIMAGWRRAVELAMTGEEIQTLTALARSRTEPASRVSRAAMLLAYHEKLCFFAIGQRFGVHHQTVQRCVERAVADGPLAALDDRPRPGKEPTITPEAKAWLVSVACDKAKEHGYPHELWTTRLLARHARQHGPAAGHRCLAHLVQGTVCKILGQEEIKPHKVRYYLERRDAAFEQKMAEVLCVYREVQVLKKAAAKSKQPSKSVAIVSYDEKPGIQAIATTAPDLPPEPGVYATFARDYEYRRHGTLSLLAGIDLLNGKVHALVRDRHRSREFIEFLKLLDAAYPAGTAIKLILDNHSAHISRETRTWLAAQPSGRFDFTFTPKHGSWLNLVEGFFSKFARSVLRHIRVASKHELKQRIMAGINDINRHPVIHTWSYKLAEAA